MEITFSTSRLHARLLTGTINRPYFILLLLLPILPIVGLPLLSVQPTPSIAQADTLLLPTGEWYTYANGDDILVLEIEGDVLWAGTRAGGLVRWNTTDPSTGLRRRPEFIEGTGSSYVQFLKPQDGLAGNTVYDIAIDDHGYKWLATDHGLSVLDDNGTADKADDTWHTYTRQSTVGQLPSNHVTAVAVDEAGYVWIGSSQYWDPDAQLYVGGGLSKLDTRGTLDPGDDVWLHTYTLENTLTRGRGGETLGLASNNIIDILPVPGNPSTGSGHGRVWVATRQHWLFVEPDENIPGRWIQTHGGLSRLDHAGTAETDDDTWQTWNCEENSQFGCVVTQLRMDKYGYIWAPMRGRGVLTFHRDASTLRPERDRFTTADGLESNFVDAIALGPSDDPQWENTVWFSTYNSLTGQGHGVSVLNHKGTPGNHRDDTWNADNPSSGQPITTANGLVSERVRAMVAGSGVMWMGAGGIHGQADGISPFNLTQGTFRDPLTTAASGPPSNYITDVALGKAGTQWENQVWVATGNRWERKWGVGASLLNTQGTLDAGDDTWSHFTREGTDDDGQPPWIGLASNNVLALAVDGNNVWFGTREATWDASRRAYTDGGLSIFDGERWAVRTADNTGEGSTGLRSNSVTALAVGCNGELWIGLGNLQDNFGAGVDILETADDVHDLANDVWWDPFIHPPLPSNLVSDIAPDCNQRRLWVSSVPHFTGSRIQGGGAGVYNYHTSQWTVYTKADGMQSYTDTGITGNGRSIAVGPDGTVWVGAWGTTVMSREDVISSWPYVPAVVNWFRDGNWTAKVFQRDGWVSSIAIDAAGLVWAGTSRGGMDINQHGQEEEQEIVEATGGIKLTTDGINWVSWSPDNSPLVSDDIEVISVAPDGDVWIGTSGWGLMRFHPGQAATPTATSTSTPTQVPPTLTPTNTNTPTQMPPTPTPTSTPTRVSSTPTPTATAAGHAPRKAYLPLIAINWGTYLVPPVAATPSTPTSTPTGTATPVPATPTATATEPSPGDSPRFNCGGWCEVGSSPGMRRQTVTSDRPVDDWRMLMTGLSIGILHEETSSYTIVEAPEGYHVRVEALFQGEWLPACESDVECPLPAPTSTGTDTPTATSTSTPTQVPPTLPPTNTSTPTQMPPTLTPTNTSTPTQVPPTPTLTSTPTRVSPTSTPTATAAGHAPRKAYLPLIAINWGTHLVPLGTATPSTPTSTPTGTATPTATATEPSPGDSPRFNCGGWCEVGSSPGMRRQTVTSDRPVDDWRMLMTGLSIGILHEETSSYTIVEAPEGYHVRIEALFQGEWLLACESDVECPLPTPTLTGTATPTHIP
ncbi:MAG: two-component regulator propeller domain-containing protein [Anaerolineae bacterium]